MTHSDPVVQLIAALNRQGITDPQDVEDSLLVLLKLSYALTAHEKDGSPAIQLPPDVPPQMRQAAGILDIKTA